MKKEIHKSVTRKFNLTQLKAWYVGEKDYLKRVLGVGFENTIYVCENNQVTFYYEDIEVKKFEIVLETLIGEEEFNDIVDNYMMFIDEIPKCKIDGEKLLLFSKLVPALTIFNEFDEYPEYMEEDMTRRLMRVRTSTEAKPYELLDGVGSKEPKDFILFKGEVYIKK